MKIFGRLFVSHLLTAVVASAGIVVGVGLLSPTFYGQHLDRLASTGISAQAYRAVLAEGHQRVMLLALAISLPIALVLAMTVSYREARRVATAAEKLEVGSRALAGGHYTARLEVAGNDELTAIAQHFNELAEGLAATEAERSALIGIVAHELHTPLSALQGYTEAFAEKLMPLDAVATAMNRELEAMRRVTNDLLLVSRIEARGVEIRRTPCSAAGLLADAYDRFQPIFEERGLALKLQETSLLPSVYADYDRVLQVLSNLLANALRYTPTGGLVVVGAGVQEGAVRFFVSDDGPGIASAHQQRIFERFYRIDPARSHRDGGSGIGLTVAKGLVEAMGGRIGLESEEGRGSRFYFTCPACSSDDQCFPELVATARNYKAQAAKRISHTRI